LPSGAVSDGVEQPPGVLHVIRIVWLDQLPPTITAAPPGDALAFAALFDRFIQNCPATRSTRPSGAGSITTSSAGPNLTSA